MAQQRGGALSAVIFDLDGVLVDSERVWNDARRDVATAHGGRWPSDAQRAMMGMSSTEWSAYMHEQLGLELAPAEISSTVVARLGEIYRERLPLIPGAREAVVALARANSPMLIRSGRFTAPCSVRLPPR